MDTNKQNALNAARKKMSPCERAEAYSRSAKHAIAAYCYHQCHKEQARNSHTTKRAIKNCEVKTCHLWPHRGFQNIGDGVAGRKRDQA